MTLLERPVAAPTVEEAATSPRRSARAWWPMVVPPAVALLLRAIALGYPGQLTGVSIYDDGVYVGQVLRFLHGALPYRGFTMVEPPGLVILLSPVVALAHLWGSDAALVACRVTTVLVDVTNVVLVGRLLRYRGRRAQLVAMTALALYPAALNASATVLLEPYLNLFCLLGALATFRDGEVAGWRRVVLGGLMFGVAGSVKIWAIFPVLVICIGWMFRHRNRLAPFVAGTGLGFAVISVPFAVLTPGASLHQAVLAQIIRNSGSPTGGWRWLAVVDGSMFFTSREGPTLIIGAVIACSFTGLLVRHLRRRGGHLDALELCALMASAVILAAFYWSDSFTPHYAAFLGPFFAILLGSTAASFDLGHRLARRALTVVLAVLLAVVLVVELGPIDAQHQITLGGAIGWIPLGSCVLTDDPAYLIVANRFEQPPSCPDVIDTFGATMVMSGGLVPAQVEEQGTEQTVDQWERILDRANYLVLSSRDRRDLPVTSGFESWLHRSFAPVAALPHHAGEIYRRR